MIGAHQDLFDELLVPLARGIDLTLHHVEHLGSEEVSRLTLGLLVNAFP